MKKKLALVLIGFILPAASILACLGPDVPSNPAGNNGVCYCNSNGTVGTCTAGVAPGPMYCGSALAEGKSGVNCTTSMVDHWLFTAVCSCVPGPFYGYNCSMGHTVIQVQVTTDTACP